MDMERVTGDTSYLSQPVGVRRKGKESEALVRALRAYYSRFKIEMLII
jgi:hypothetical protein